MSFTVEDGEVFDLLGPNGAGKTAAIRTLLGLLSPTSGGAALPGRDAAGRAYDRLAAISPTAQYDPSAVPVNAESDAAGAVVLLAATVALVLFAALRFRRADLAG